MKTPKIGSIIEITTKKGLAYAQVTHRNPKWGYLIRVFADLHQTRPALTDKVAAGSVQFSTFYPVAAAAKAAMVSVVGVAPVSSMNALFPVFKNGIEDPKTGRVAVWWLWDGEKEWRAGELSHEEVARYPYLEIITGDVLPNRIEKEWRQSDAP